MVVFKMRDSVPSPRYSPVCNVLREWKTSLIPTYSLPTLCYHAIIYYTMPFNIYYTLSLYTISCHDILYHAIIYYTMP